MKDNIDSPDTRKIQEQHPSEFSFETSLWKGSFKVTTKNMTANETGEMLKQVIGWRRTLFWLILSLLAIFIAIIALRPQIIAIQWSG